MDNICPSDFETDSCLALNCEADLAQKGSQRWWRSPIEVIAMSRRIAITVIVAAFVGLLGFLFLAWRPAIAPIKHPDQASFTAESIARGEVLSAAGHCVSCHTRPGGQPFAGGYG